MSHACINVVQSLTYQDAIFLRSGVNPDEPITKYLPALADAKSLVSWENITLGALAGQVAGVVPNCETSDIPSLFVRANSMQMASRYDPRHGDHGRC